ncbi:VOC family protein [Bacillus cereus]
MLFSIIGWRKLNEVAYSTGESEIYFKEVDEEIVRTLGPRHICYQAINRKVVDEVAEFLSSTKIKIIRGPMEMNHYSEGYYTIDFYDPNGFIIEVAYTPNAEM